MKKNTGIIRKVDTLGRIVLPIETRRRMGITDGTPLEMYVEDDTIVLRKYEQEGGILEELDKFEKIFDCLCNFLPVGKIVSIKQSIEDIRKDLTNNKQN